MGSGKGRSKRVSAVGFAGPVVKVSGSPYPYNGSIFFTDYSKDEPRGAPRRSLRELLYARSFLNKDIYLKIERERDGETLAAEFGKLYEGDDMNLYIGKRTVMDIFGSVWNEAVDVQVTLLSDDDLVRFGRYKKVEQVSF